MIPEANTSQPDRTESTEVRHLKKKLPDLLPARMLNEFVYCPRLFYYEWVEGVFESSADTLEGSAKHSRVDTEPGAMPAADEMGSEVIHSRSISLSSERLGLIAKLDLVESDPANDESGSVRPVDYKKGRPREVDGALEPWSSDKIQVAAQVFVLRDNGYRCDEGILYYSYTKQRVRVPVDDALMNETEQFIRRAKDVASSARIPDPLVDSPKCPRCSLVGICLPDETNALQARSLRFENGGAIQLQMFDENNGRNAAMPVRQLVAPREALRPLYLNSQGVRVGKSGEVIQVRDGDELKQEVRLGEVSQINLLGNVQLSTQAIQTFCAAEIPVCYFSQGGWFYGITSGLNSRNVFLRHQQFMSAEHDGTALRLSRKLVAGKIRNQRTLLQRNHIEPPERALGFLRALSDRADAATDIESLLGIEGSAARVYFSEFAGMLKAEEEDDHRAQPAQFRFDFTARNRRPPRDPVNALLSLAYSLLVKDLTVTCYALGFDPYWGFYHQPRFGRPALALDLMEPFRSLIADSAVLTAINTRMVTPADFVQSGPSVALKPGGRKGFFRAYELRMDTLVTHPMFDYRVSYRRVLEIQARLLARFLNGEIDDYPVFVTR